MGMPRLAAAQDLQHAAFTKDIQRLGDSLRINEKLAYDAQVAIRAATVESARLGQNPAPLQEIAKGLFDPRLLRAQFDAELQALHPDDIQAATAFFDSDLGKKALRLIYAAQYASWDRDILTIAMLDWAMLKTSHQNRQRVLLVQALTEEMQTYAAEDMRWSNGFFAYINALSGALPLDQRMSYDQSMAASEFDPVVRMWRAAGMERACAITAMTFASLSDLELALLVQHYDSAEGRAVAEAVSQALDLIWRVQSERQGVAVARLIPR